MTVCRWSRPGFSIRSMRHNIADPMTDFAVPIDDLTPKKRNPNQGDVGNLCVLFETIGQRWPIAYRTNGEHKIIQAGNHRWHAAKALGWEAIAAVDLDDLTDDQAEAFAIGDNRSRDLATTDESLLAALLAELATKDRELLAITGYDGDDLDQLLEYANRNDFYVNPSDEPSELHDIETEHTCPQCGFQW